VSNDKNFDINPNLKLGEKNTDTKTNNTIKFNPGGNMNKYSSNNTRLKVDKRFQSRSVDRKNDILSTNKKNVLNQKNEERSYSIKVKRNKYKSQDKTNSMPHSSTLRSNQIYKKFDSEIKGSHYDVKRLKNKERDLDSNKSNETLPSTMDKSQPSTNLNPSDVREENGAPHLKKYKKFRNLSLELVTEENTDAQNENQLKADLHKFSHFKKNVNSKFTAPKTCDRKFIKNTHLRLNSPKSKESKKNNKNTPRKNIIPFTTKNSDLNYSYDFHEIYNQMLQTHQNINNLQNLLKQKKTIFTPTYKENKIDYKISNLYQSPNIGNKSPSTKKTDLILKKSPFSNTNPLHPFKKKEKLDKEVLLNKYSSIFSDFEKQEINSIEELYFLGKSITNKMSLTNILNSVEIYKNSGLNNQLDLDQTSQFDDENQNYIINLGEHIYYRYEILEDLGRGSFGQAMKCFDHKFKKKVCLKMIKNNQKFFDQALIELKILEKIKKLEDEKWNIIRFHEHFIFRNHICFIFELFEINLYDYMRSNNFIGLDNSLIKKISIQILNSLIFLSKNKIIHCDLKPENLMVKQGKDFVVKLIDFGSSCLVDDKMYAYIQSRFYRAPEVILGLEYDTQIDMWSYGCILVELYTGSPIFPGENELDQFAYFAEYLGLPPKNMLDYSPKYFEYLDSDGNILNYNNKPRKPSSKKLSKLLRNCEEVFLDLISKCLVWDPVKRIKPSEAVLHPWNISGMNKAKLQFYKQKWHIIEDTSGNGKNMVGNEDFRVEEINLNPSNNV
jgi:dual specificity tyrosine-phosphorylation-regulated kinase 2/3/4